MIVSPSMDRTLLVTVDITRLIIVSSLRTTFLFLLLLMSFASFSTYANEAKSSEDDWKTISIDGFQIHFQQKYEQSARSIAATYMLYRPILEEEFDHKPERMDIVVKDSSDLSNGWSIPIPENTNTIYLTPAIDGSLISQQNWLDLVSLHEMTHLYHIDKAEGTLNNLRYFFGRFYLFFPNIFQTKWAIEGLATYRETNQELNYGRGSNGFFDAIMRLEHKRGFRSINDATYKKLSFPTGASYYYGYYFFEFLHREYGSDAVKQYVNSFSERVIPFRIDDQVKKSFGISIYSLWENFYVYLTDKFGKQIETITNAGLSQAEVSSGFSLSSQQAKYDNKGNLYYIRYDGHSSPVIRRISADKKEPLDIVELYYPGYFDVLNNGKLVYSQLNLCDSGGSGTIYYDLYVLDQESGDESRLGSCQRYKFVRWHPDGKSIFTTRYSNGQSELLSIDTKGNVIDSLLLTEGKDTIGSFAVSRNGRKLIISLFRQEHGWELYQLDTEKNNKLTRLTNNNDVELDPSYSHDGQFIVYTSNHGNVYNVWQLPIKPGSDASPKAITNVISAAFGASVHPNNSTMAYSQMGESGYRINIANIETRDATILKREIKVTHEDKNIHSDSKIQEASTKEAVDYSAFNNYSAPAYWLPLFLFDEHVKKIGFYTIGSDQLQRHVYSLEAIYGRAHYHKPLNGFEGKLEYSYNNQISIEYSLEKNLYQLDYLNEKSLYQTDRRLSLLPIFDLYSNKQHTSNLAAYLSRYEASFDLGEEAFTKMTTNIAGLMFLYSGSRKYYHNHTGVEGSSIQLLAEKHINTEEGNKGNGDKEDGNSVAVMLKKNFNLGKSHSINIGYVQAKRDEEISPFVLGGTSINDQNMIPFNKQFYDLPGYVKGFKELTTREFRLLTLNYIFPISKNGFGLLAPPIGLGERYIKASTQSAFIDKPLPTQERNVYSNLILSFNAEISLGFGLINLPVKAYYARGLDKDIGSTETGIMVNQEF